MSLATRSGRRKWERKSEARFAFRQQHEPPLAPRVAFSFVTANEVALTDHANGRAITIEDGHRADMVFEEKFSDIPEPVYSRPLR